MKVKEITNQINKCGLALKELSLALSINEIEQVSMPREKVIEIYDLISKYEGILIKVAETTEVSFYGY